MSLAQAGPRRATRSVAGWAYHDGRFVRLQEAVVGVTTQALQYGTGIFEGIRAYTDDRGGISMFRAADHFRRFLDGCRVLRIDLGLDEEALCATSAELLRRNGTAADMYLRPLAYKHRLLPDTPPGVHLAGISDALSIVAFELGSYSDPQGIRCAISPWRRLPDTSLPVRAKITGGYVNNALALDGARAAGYSDAILLNGDGRVSEATTSNVFAVRAGQLLTPPAGADILEGITRDTVLTLAQELLGVPAGCAELTRDDLFTADEVFLTGTGAEIVPVVELAGRAVGTGGPGPVTSALIQAYRDAVRGRSEAYRHWLTPVPGLPAPRAGDPTTP